MPMGTPDKVTVADAGFNLEPTKTPTSKIPKVPSSKLRLNTPPTNAAPFDFTTSGANNGVLAMLISFSKTKAAAVSSLLLAFTVRTKFGCDSLVTSLNFANSASEALEIVATPLTTA